MNRTHLPLDSLQSLFVPCQWCTPQGQSSTWQAGFQWKSDVKSWPLERILCGNMQCLLNYIYSLPTTDKPEYSTGTDVRLFFILESSSIIISSQQKNFYTGVSNGKLKAEFQKELLRAYPFCTTRVLLLLRVPVTNHGWGGGCLLHTFSSPPGAERWEHQ